MVTAFEQGTAFRLSRETTDRPGQIGFRFHPVRSVPVELLTTIGDALHNMRSCLDSVAYELARRHLGDDMTEKKQGATRFRLFGDPVKFDSFLRRSEQRALYGENERNALRCVQPFALREEAGRLGAAFATSPQQEHRMDQLARLSHLNNLDKHRYLPLLGWYIDLVCSTTDVTECTWRTAQPQRGGYQDNDLIGHLTFPGAANDPSADLRVDMHLALADDPAYAGDFTSTLEGWLSYLTGWVLPRIFIVADGNPPPIAIFG